MQQFRESLVSETAAQTKVMMLTSFAKEQMVLAAFAAGADSYCVKTIKFELLLEALHITHEGQSWIDPAITRIVLKHTRQGAAAMVKPNATQTVTISAIDPEQASILQADPLINRELEVLELIVQGYSNNEIAQKLYLSLGSVKVYVRGVLNKLCASDRTQAAVLALQDSVLSAEC
ncbi:LuxR C-terminal-related transcriptional regulator [Nostoc sp.]